MSPTPLALLLDGRYQELLARMRNPSVRGQLLAEVVGSLNAQPNASAQPSIVLEQRQLNMLAGGDWSWGILTPAQRRQFLIRDARLLLGSGEADAGAAQLAALVRLKGELGNLYDSLDLALRDDDLGWLLPLAEHLASLLEIMGEFASMQERYSTLLEAALRLGNLRLELHARLGLSLALCKLGRYADAQSEAAAAAQLAVDNGIRPLQAAALHLKGSAQAMAADYAGARESLRLALDLRRELGERHGEIATMSNLAYVEQCQGRRDDSRRLLLAALSVCRELGDCRGEAMFLQNLGALAYGAGNYAEAAELAEQALRILNMLEDRPGSASALCALGFAEYGAQNFENARGLLEQACSACHVLGDNSSESLALIALGNLSWLGGNAAETFDQYNHALELCRANGDRLGEARALCGLGHHAIMLDDAAGAAGWYAQAFALFADIGELTGLADCLVYAAGLLFARPEPSALQAASNALNTALAQASMLQHNFDPLDRRIASNAQQLLGAARESGSWTETAAPTVGAIPPDVMLLEQAEVTARALEYHWPGCR